MVAQTGKGIRHKYKSETAMNVITSYGVDTLGYEDEHQFIGDLESNNSKVYK